MNLRLLSYLLMGSLLLWIVEPAHSEPEPLHLGELVTWHYTGTHDARCWRVGLVDGSHVWLVAEGTAPRGVARTLAAEVAKGCAQ